MKKEKDELVKVEYIIPKSVEKEIVERITETVKDAYYWDVTKAISDKVIEQFNSEGFATRISEAVLEKIKISEDDFIEGVTAQIKEALIKTTSIIAKQVLRKVQEKVQSYGFIKIGDRL